MTRLAKLISLLLMTSIMVAGCSKQSEDEELDTFDRQSMLRNYADNLIKPSFNTLQTKTNALQSAISTLVSSVNQENLDAAQTAWIEAYTAFQSANGYNFGPAGESGTRKALIEEIGTFPVAAAEIETVISSGTFNFNDFNRDARGFLTVEYLLFNLSNDDAAIITALSDANRKAYLSGCIDNIKVRVDVVVSEWEGDYYNTFISNTGTDVGSSTSLFYNEFVKTFEAFKNFKLGLPLGLRPGQVTTEAARVEAYYSGQSLAMLTAHFNAIERIWYGQDASGAQGLGFKAYLESVEGGPALVAATIDQLAIIREALSNVPASPALSIQIVDSPTVLETLHTEVQKHTRYFKSDMSSILGIAITFSSGDGD
jgi:uncharacterized protein